MVGMLTITLLDINWPSERSGTVVRPDFICQFRRYIISLTYLRTGPPCFQAGDRKRRPNLALVTHAGCVAAGVGRAFSRVCLCLFVFLSVCSRPKRKTALAINTKLSAHNILHSSRSACIDQEVKRSRSHGYENRHGRTVASDACCYNCRVLLLPAWVCMSIRLPMFSSLFVLCYSIFCYRCIFTFVVSDLVF